MARPCQKGGLDCRMEGRLWELHQSEEPSVRTTRQKQLKELRKACKNKGEIKTYLELHHNVELTGNETLKSMQARAYEELMKASPALREDKMEFGKHSAMEYQEVILNDPNYTDWCITTMMETGGMKGHSKLAPEALCQLGSGSPQGPSGPCQASQQVGAVLRSASIQRRAGGWMSLVLQPGEFREEPHQHREGGGGEGGGGGMFSESETENRIQALEDQIRDLRRQGKKGKTNSEEKQ